MRSRRAPGRTPDDGALRSQEHALLNADRGAELRNGPQLALRASGEQRDRLQEIDLAFGNPMPHVTTCAGLELRWNASWSVASPAAERWILGLAVALRAHPPS